MTIDFEKLNKEHRGSSISYRFKDEASVIKGLEREIEDLRLRLEKKEAYIKDMLYSLSVLTSLIEKNNPHSKN